MKFFLDSSTNYLYLSLEKEGKYTSFVRLGKNDHSETMVDFIQKFFEDNQVTMDDIDEIYVGKGPGSYTGIRLAGTVAKVLACIKNKKFYSFSSLDLLLASKANENGKFLATIWAKKDHSYYKAMEVNENQIHFECDDSYNEDTVLDTYQNYQRITVDTVFTQDYQTLSEQIIHNHWYKEEDVYEFVPNYLRNSING